MVRAEGLALFLMLLAIRLQAVCAQADGIPSTTGSGPDSGSSSSTTLVQWADPPSPTATTPAGSTDESGGTASGYITANRPLTVAACFSGLILIAAGFVFGFIGKRAFVSTIFLSGVFSFGIVLTVCLDITQQRWRSFGPNADWIYLLLVTPFAVLGGFVHLRVTQLGVVAIGGLLGLTWIVAVLFTGLGASLDANGHTVLLIVVTAAGCAAIFFMEHLVTILGTANAGAFSVAVGVDMFARTGFVETVKMCLVGNPLPRSGAINGPAWGLLASAVVLAMAGWFVQTRPGPPPQPSPYNPAYWLFGAAMPPPLPAVWFKMPGRETAPVPPPRPAFSITNYLNPFGWKW
ncbi:hypothetical protein DFJ73DRAFT_797796 [Zopfochytrium polystomum]|nr:hypothetical protein DFJ73DRAFT_797796 [Zopfochytrium polystomum]